MTNDEARDDGADVQPRESVRRLAVVIALAVWQLSPETLAELGELRREWQDRPEGEH